MHTARLEVRLPTEVDRGRFVELFCDEIFMVFSGGVLDAAGAHRRFDQMLERGVELRFAKQPVVERATRSIIGYVGVDFFEFEGQQRLEFGYRLVEDARGRGYATEAGRALLGMAAQAFTGELLAIINPLNRASQKVATKLGFGFWKQALVDDGYPVHLFRAQVG